MLKVYKTDRYNGVMLYGEAAGAEEEKQGLPFVGPSGKLLDKILEEAGLTREECIISNIFMSERPPNNLVNHFFVGIREATKDGIPYCEDIPKYNGKRLRKCFQFEMDRIQSEIKEYSPKIIVALGATALWGLTGFNGITLYRGRELLSKQYNKTIIPTFHPSYLLRNRKMIPIVINDFRLAKKYVGES